MAETHEPRQRPALGIALRVGSMFVFAGMSALVKLCGEAGVPVFQMIFFRNAFAFVPLGLYIWRTSGWSVLRTNRPLGHVLRSAIGLFGMVCGFSALQRLPLTAATALSFAAPLFMTALAVPILKEKVGPHRWAAVAVGFVGVMIMVRPDPGHMNLLGALFGLGGAIGSAAAMTTIREIGRTERGPTIVFYFTLAGALMGLASLPFGWVAPTPGVLTLLVLMGLIGGVGQLLLTEALRVAPVGVVAPFDYTQLLWASLLGFVIWGELPRPWTIAGALIVAASGVYILYRELRRRRPG
ncbi:MAG TPA: DMT family transporter [Caulobacteraceae bacterium]|jgi:drug/metabolite transporter (DMT)-like permease|nr:DMT family transporter [Caulobacteraceae bacterium]